MRCPLSSKKSKKALRIWCDVIIGTGNFIFCKNSCFFTKSHHLKYAFPTNYETFSPHADLASFVNCYWELEVEADPDVQKQRVIPDGYIEMFFILGDEVRRFTTGTAYILQPRAMVMGQITGPFYIQPTGYVKTFAIRFYSYGFANFVQVPLKDLANKETPLENLLPGSAVLQKIRKMQAVRSSGSP